jgi:arylsulfatase A-like enzyme
MAKLEEKIPLFHQVVVSAFIALLLAMLDLLLFKSTSTLSSEETFLFSFGLLNASIFGYLLSLFISLGIGVGFLSSIIQWIIRKHNFNFGKTFHVFFCTGLLSLIFIVLRGLSGIEKEFLKYLIHFFLVVILLCFCFVVVSIFSKKYSHLKMNERCGERIILFILIASLVIVLGIPLISEFYLRFRFHKEKEKSSYPNIILIIMDTVRADSLSCYQHSKKTTPNIDKIAKEGMIFLNVLSPAPWTLPAHASLFTGLYPSQHKAGLGHQYLDEGFPTLAEYLSEIGYVTVGFTENPYASKDFGLAQGFRDFYEMYIYRKMAITPAVIDNFRSVFLNYKKTRECARDTVTYFKSWIHKNYYKKNSKPFFAFLNFMPAHLPNYPRPQFQFRRPSRDELRRIEPVNRKPERFYLPKYRLNENELNIMRTLYEGDVAYLDSKLGELFEFLKNSHVLDNSVLILTSDHGENFGDHDLIEHVFCLYNSLLHVPLIIRYQNKIKPGTTNTELVSTIFLFQTVVDLIGAQKNKNIQRIENRSLLKLNKEKYIYAEHDNAVGMLKYAIGDEAPEDFNYEPFDKYLECVYGSDYKFIWSSSGRHELYDLKMDWQEKKNLVSEEELIANSLYNQLQTWQKNIWKPQISSEVKKMDKKTLDALKSLGYIR